jgi:homeobox-leucine zipper protein
MGEDCDLGLGLAIGSCEFKPIFNHDNKHLFGQHNILFPPRVKEIRDREVEVTSRREGGNIKRPKSEKSFVAKDLSDCNGDDSSSGLTRKKLRLTKEQSLLLEDSFRAQQILSSV